MNLIGDVKGKVAVMLDDMIDTAGKEKKLVFHSLILLNLTLLVNSLEFDFILISKVVFFVG